MSVEIEKAYEYCRGVTKLHAKSFYFAAKFLPVEKQRAVYPIYAFCRHVDDEIDELGESVGEAESIAAVERWRANLENVYLAANLDDSDALFQEMTTEQAFVMKAWSDLLKTYKIPRRLPLDLVQGVLMDTTTKRYETFEELYVYCYRVASTVGLMSSEILGYQDLYAPECAEAMGIGMQLTNILRDVKEDAEKGRIYLPQEELLQHGIDDEQILAGEYDSRFAEMMKFQVDRARGYYRKGEYGIGLLERDSRFTVLVASRIYSKILDEIEKQNYNVFVRRAHTTRTQKLLSLPQIWRELKKF